MGQILNQLDTLGVKVRVVGDNLLLTPAASVPLALREEIAENKYEIVAEIRAAENDVRALAEKKLRENELGARLFFPSVSYVAYDILKNHVLPALPLVPGSEMPPIKIAGPAPTDILCAAGFWLEKAMPHIEEMGRKKSGKH